MTAKLRELMADVNRSLTMAYERRKEFSDAAVNWADLSCTRSLEGIDSFGDHAYVVIIEEASPSNPELQDFIYGELLEKWGSVEIHLEW